MVHVVAAMVAVVSAVLLPAAANAAVIAPANPYITTFPPINGKTITIADGPQLLPPNDENMLRDVTAQAALPPVVTHVDFITLSFPEPINIEAALWDNVQKFRPDLLSPERTRYADGHLIVAVNFDGGSGKGSFGFFSGDDVKQSAQLTDQARTQGVLAAMKPGMNAQHRAEGMAQAIRAIADPRIGEAALQEQEKANNNTTVAGAPLKQWSDPNHVAVTVWDGASKLSNTDMESLHQNTLNIALPSDVKSVDYFTFGNNSDSLNDTLQAHLKLYRPDLLTPDREKYADGHLIVVVGFSPHKNAIYGGEDVAQAVGLRDQQRLETLTAAPKEDLRAGRYVDAMIESVTAAANPDYQLPVDTGKKVTNIVATVASVAVFGGGLLSIIGVFIHTRKNRTRQAREAYNHAAAEYGRIASSLDAIDIRANSLTSSFANDELRAQWEDVKQRFLQLHATMDSISHLADSGTNKQFYKSRATIAAAREEATKIAQAEENIELLYSLEHGDHDARRKQLRRVRSDVYKAKLDAPTLPLRQECDALVNRLDTLLENVTHPSFMDDFTQVLSDYQVASKAIRDHAMPKVLDKDNRAVPRLDSYDWNVGLGHTDFIPYGTLSSWNSSDTASISSDSSGGDSSGSYSVDTSYSDSSFSGAGGSSDW